MSALLAQRSGSGIMAAGIALATLICLYGALPAQAGNPLAPAAPFAGKFANDKLAVELAASDGGYVGTITLGGNQFPAKASASAQGLAGTFTASGNSYPFTATLSDDRLVLISGGATYALTRVGANPLAGLGPAPAPANPLQKTAAAETPSPAGDHGGDGGAAVGEFSLLGSTSAGKTLFIKLPGAPSLESAITQTADALGKQLDAKPALSGAFANQSRTRGGAALAAKLKGADVHGVIFCDIANHQATATVVVARADAAPADVATLMAFLPAQQKMDTHTFPDGSGSIDLPPGWTTQQQSATYGMIIKGPAGQSVGISVAVHVYTPDCSLLRLGRQNYQLAMGNYQFQVRNYQQMLQMHQRYPNMPIPREPVKPKPPNPEKDLPNLIICRYCAGAEEVLKYYYPLMEQRAKNAGLPYTTVDKVIEIASADHNPYMSNAKAGLVYLAVTDHVGDKTTAMRVLNRIETFPILDGKESWFVHFNSMRAPDATFDRDLPVMNAIRNSLKVNMDVVNKQMQADGDAVRKMGDDNERALLKRGREFNASQAQNFNRFESQMAAQQQARHDSSSDFIEYIRGVRDVYDVNTGKTAQVDLFNVNGIVNGMNAAANDPNRFVQIPLRYER